MRMRRHLSLRILGAGTLAGGLLLLSAGIVGAPTVRANQSNNDGNPHVCDNPSNARGVHDDTGDPGASGTKGNGNGKDCPIATPTPTPPSTITTSTTTSTSSAAVSGASTSSSGAAGVSALAASAPTIATPVTGADVPFGAGGLLALAGLVLLGLSARRRRHRIQASGP
jgi:uncharacterized protein (TIGR03382 family)